MFTIKLIFVSLLVCAGTCYASKAPALGYLFVNGSLPPYCYDLAANEICPPNLVDYKILGFDSGDETVATFELQSVKFSLATLDFFDVTETCRDSVREYSCSNNFAVCTPDSKYGVNVKYNFERTEAACASIKANCPELVQEAITFNCSFIQKDVTGYSYCLHLPEVPGDVCSKSNYKYPATLADLYKITAKAFPANLAVLIKDKLFVNSTCEQEYVDIICQMMRGSICSTTLRMYAISQQECSTTMTQCISSTLPVVQNYFQQACKLFPDATTAKRVPLPSVAMNNIVEN